MELFLSAIVCGLVLGVLWMAGRRVSQADTVAMIGQTYLRAAGRASCPAAEPAGERQKGAWDC